ncbi:hypothetical protein ULG90_09015 [Halopseudomonas pachastrellae]|nr:hypothetical protein ULG90_09015 [Halopseudomonas pachastrellae]
MADAPEQRVDVIEGVLGRDSYPVGGIGELGIEAISPALTAAIENAAGVRADKLPVRPTTLLTTMQELQP